MVVTSNGRAITADGTEFKFNDDASRAKALSKARAYDAQARSAAELKAGRPLSDSEWHTQTVKVATDSRSHQQRYHDEHWAPKKRGQLSPTEKLLAEAQRDVEQSTNRYSGLSPQEALALTLSEVVDSEHDQAAADKAKAKYLESIAPKLAVLDQMIKDENRNPNSDEAFRVKLQQTRQTLLTPDADGRTLHAMLKDIDAVVQERAIVAQSGLLQEQALLTERLEQNAKQFDLLNTQEPLPQESMPKVTIDKSKPLEIQADQLFHSVKDQDFQTVDEVFNACRALDDGDSAPIEALLADCDGSNE